MLLYVTVAFILEHLLSALLMTANAIAQSMKKCDLCTLKCDKINMIYKVI